MFSPQTPDTKIKLYPGGGLEDENDREDSSGCLRVLQELRHTARAGSGGLVLRLDEGHFPGRAYKFIVFRPSENDENDEENEGSDVHDPMTDKFFTLRAVKRQCGGVIDLAAGYIFLGFKVRCINDPCCVRPGHNVPRVLA